MVRGLRVTDSVILQRLCGADMKLFLRVGALLQAKLAFSEPALEAIVADDAGKKLALDRRLRDAVPDQFAALAEEAGAADLGLVLVDEAAGAEPGWRVVALEDELGNPLLAANQPSADTAPLAGLSSMVSTLAPALRAPVEGLLQARADDQRAAALEQLRYAMPPLPVVSELMPMILSDGAELVRERAIGLLVGAGANALVVDLIRALIRKDDVALARYAEPAGRLPVPQQDLIMAAVLAALTRGHATQAVVDLCQHLAGHLARHRSLERLMELLLPARLSLLDLVRTLQAVDAGRINAALVSQLGLSAERDATLVVLLAAPDGAESVPERDRLISRGIELLLSPSDRPPERMALAAALRRLDRGPGLGRRLAERAPELTKSYDTSVHWLLAELCRDGMVTPEAGELLAGALRRLLRDAPGPHLVAILEQQLPALLPASEPTRRALVEPMVETVARFIDDRSRDLVSSCLSGIGATAVEPLWTMLEEHPHQAIRLLAAELMPELLMQADDATTRAAVARLLAGLARAGQANERSALVTAAARLAASAALATDPQPVRTVDAALGGLGPWAIEALGHLAATSHLGEERRGAIVGTLLDDIAEELPDAPVETVTDAATDEVTFILDERLGAHTENVPKLLAALLRIGSARDLPRELLRTIVNRLSLQWRRVSGWKTIWGPGNIQELGRTLGLLAEAREFPGPLRLQVCEALLPSIAQLTVARSLGRVFTGAEGSFLSRLAGKAAERLIELTSEKYWAEDEWEELAEVLVDYLAIPHLGPDGPAIRRKLIGVLAVYRGSLTSRGRAKLRYLAGELDAELRAKLDWVG
jgi:hypothetical protein